MLLCVCFHVLHVYFIAMHICNSSTNILPSCGWLYNLVLNYLVWMFHYVVVISCRLLPIYHDNVVCWIHCLDWIEEAFASIDRFLAFYIHVRFILKCWASITNGYPLCFILKTLEGQEPLIWNLFSSPEPLQPRGL